MSGSQKPPTDKALGPHGKSDLSKTLGKFKNTYWNKQMAKSFSTMKSGQSQINDKDLAAAFILQSLDPETGKSCLPPENLKEVLEFVGKELLKGEAEGDTASGNDKRTAGKTGEVPGKMSQIAGKPAKEFDRQSPKPASGTAGKTGEEPGQANQITGKPAEESDRQSSKSASGICRSGIMQPKESMGSPKMKNKPKEDHGQKTQDVGSVESEDNTKALLACLEKHKTELAEKEDKYQLLSQKVQEKGEALNLLRNENGTLKAEIEKGNKDRECLLNTLSVKEEEFVKLNNKISQLNEEKKSLEAQIKEKEDKFSRYREKNDRENKRKFDELYEHCQREIRTRDNQLSDIKKERDDLKTRFSKLAGAKLTDQNADIADLSDPNRAMKVSEKFGTLYDDEWTDAFEELKKKKIPVKDAIQLLLNILQECLTFCNKLKDQQMDSLNNVLLHPSQDVSKFVNEPRKNVGGFKEKPRISSKDEKGVRDLRRQIGVSETCIEEVKQVFVMETKSWDKKGFDKKHLDLCMPYIQKCAEVCWLMVLHDPPLYMKMDVKHGDKMDLNLYTVYSSSGDTIDYLVWPPLYNEMGGGLISKGAAECVKSIKKK